MALTINMANVNYPDADSETLSGTTASTVTIVTSSAPCTVDFLSRAVSNTLWLRFDGTGAAAAVKHNVPIPPNQSIGWRVPADTTMTFSVASTGGTDAYTVTAVPQPVAA